uniref:C-type lectin domain-containing protein n=1 Tax=Calidris pygmaea TaxID=425635 RepID=A0A8C3JFM5_9CHAR
MNRRGRVSSATAAPAEERSCSWLNPWVFLVSVLAIKTAFVTICCFGGQYPSLCQQASLTKMKDSTSWEGCVYCPKGWKHFQEKCYYLSADKMSWPESVQNCTGMMGSQLVVINSKEEQEFLFNLAKEVSTNAFETKFYVGLAASANGQWQWVDQTPYKKAATFWKPGEPNLLFAEKCAAIHVKGKRDPNTYSNWNNVLCFTSCYRICELPVKFV